MKERSSGSWIIAIVLLTAVAVSGVIIFFGWNYGLKPF